MMVNVDPGPIVRHAPVPIVYGPNTPPFTGPPSAGKFSLLRNSTSFWKNNLVAIVPATSRAALGLSLPIPRL